MTDEGVRPRALVALRTRDHAAAAVVLVPLVG